MAKAKTNDYPCDWAIPDDSLRIKASIRAHLLTDETTAYCRDVIDGALMVVPGDKRSSVLAAMVKLEDGAFVALFEKWAREI